MMWNYCYNNYSCFFFLILYVSHWVNAKSLTRLGPKCFGTFHHYLRCWADKGHFEPDHPNLHGNAPCRSFPKRVFRVTRTAVQRSADESLEGWRGATNKETTLLVRRLTGLKEGWLTPLSSFLSLPSDSLAHSSFLSLSLSSSAK